MIGLKPVIYSHALGVEEFIRLLKKSPKQEYSGGVDSYVMEFNSLTGWMMGSLSDFYRVTGEKHYRIHFTEVAIMDVERLESGDFIL